MLLLGVRNVSASVQIVVRLYNVRHWVVSKDPIPFHGRATKLGLMFMFIFSYSTFRLTGVQSVCVV